MNLPEDFRRKMQGMLGEEYEEFLQIYEKEAVRSLRINPLKQRVPAGIKKLGLSSGPVAWEKNGYYYEDENAGKHPYHEAGVYYIQEASAMAPVALLNPEPGERILDLCAAPGGKSTQIAAYMDGEGLLVSNEIHPARAKILSENIERMGVRNAVVTNETPQKLAEAFPGYFDAILVDAPCSGEGMFRKHEEACEEWSLKNVNLCARRQDEILDCAAAMLRAGGRMVYSTCTFAPEEDEGSISRFLKRHDDFMLEEPCVRTGGMCEGVPGWGNGSDALKKTVRLWPHKVKGEGHFAAALRRAGEKERKQTGQSGCMKGLLEKDFKEYVEFEHAFLEGKRDGIYLKFGEQLYLAPVETPSLRGIKALRPGLHLGTLKKNRFEPSHALALALSVSDVKYSYDFASDGGEIRDYLRGQTFFAEGEKGWYLITVDSCSIGWGKLAGNIMKNHYPKGLRKP